MLGGWGATPVQARCVERQGGVNPALQALFPAWVVVHPLQPAPRALQAVAPCVGDAAASAAQRRRGEAAAAGRAQRGLDLFLGQNRTQGGSGLAQAF